MIDSWQTGGFHSVFAVGSIETTSKMERLDRNQWKVYQNMMQDSGKFVELLHSIEWEDGLQSDVAQAVESYLARGKDGQLGITGEGSLLTENQKDINIPAAKSDNSGSKGITISAARYASEDTATLVHYVIAVLEYTKLCVPMKAAKEKMNSIKFEQVEYERQKQETETEVTSYFPRTTINADTKPNTACRVPITRAQMKGADVLFLVLF